MGKVSRMVKMGPCAAIIGVIVSADPCLADTHLGQSPNSSVVLEFVGGLIGGCTETSDSFDWIRTLSDSSRDTVNVDPVSGAFRIPKKHVLVVTDVDWQYVHPNGAAAAGQIEILKLFLDNLTTTDSNRVLESTVTLSSQGQGGTSEAATSGIVVSAGSRLCPDVAPGPDTGGGGSGLLHLLLRGYLTNPK